MRVRPKHAHSGRLRWRRWLLVALLVPAVLLLVAAMMPEGRYLLRAAWEEGRILLRRRSIERVMVDPATPAGVRARLALTLAARRFAVDSLGLAAGETYTTYADVGRDTLLLVLSASERYRLAPHTWWYPIVGTVPYKGFFDGAAARDAAARLEQRGLDVYLRPADAFSTLGWFNDPLLSTVLDRDSVELVATVLHELAHNTLYVAGATPFNESFANFVGYRGAERFFAAHGDSVLAAAAGAAWQRERRFGQLLGRLAQRLDSVYQSAGDSAAMEAGRRASFTWARQEVGRPDWRVNNAVVLAARFYRTRLELFDEWLDAAGGDLRQAMERLERRVAGASDPYAAMRGAGPDAQ